MVKFYEHMEKIVKRIQKQLGARFPERVLQNALAKEFMDSNIQYEKELNLDILYKKNRVGYITADFYIPKQKVFNISEDIVIETKQSSLQMRTDYLSQLKMYLRTRRNQNIQNPVSKAILICWENKDMLNEDETELRFSNDVRVEVWELADKGGTLKKIWGSKNHSIKN